MKTNERCTVWQLFACALVSGLMACGETETTDQIFTGGAGGAAAARGGQSAASSAASGGSSTSGGRQGSGGVRNTGGAFSTGGSSGGTGVPVTADCNALTHLGAAIQLAVLAQDPPVQSGGVMSNGTYVLTQYQLFTGSGGSTSGGLAATMQYTIVISSSSSAGASLQGVVTATVGGLVVSEEANAVLTFSGNSYTSTLTCVTRSGSGGEGGLYTATANQIVLASVGSSGTSVATFTRQ